MIIVLLTDVNNWGGARGGGGEGVGMTHNPERDILLNEKKKRYFLTLYPLVKIPF